MKTNEKRVFVKIILYKYERTGSEKREKKIDKRYQNEMVEKHT